MTHGLTGIVLAGGMSSRFGSDKLAAASSAGGGSPTILERAIEAVSTVASLVIVVGREEQDRQPRPGTVIRAVADPEPFGGPLQALAGAIAAATGDARVAPGGESPHADLGIVVAGDMPSIVPAVLELLVGRLREDPPVNAVVLADPREPARRQPLPVAIRIEPAQAAASAALAAGDRSLVRLLARLSVAVLPAERWLAVDPDGSTLLDVDFPADLDRLRRRAADRGLR